MSSLTKRILLVDDEAMNREIFEAYLTTWGYEVDSAVDGPSCLSLVRSKKYDLILLDIMMPGMDGFEVAERLKANIDTATIPIVMVTALNAVEDRVRALEVGADDFLNKPVDKAELKARVRSLLQVKAYHDHMREYQKILEIQVRERTEDLRKALETIKGASLETIYRLARAAEYKDGETYAHIRRMSHYAASLAKALGKDKGFVETILYASPMHDIGKIGIPDSILLKPDKLTDEESQIMRQHTLIGSNILENSKSDLIEMAESIARTHHEKWDGSGYPMGIAGEEIPIEGRITALADVFDALTSERPYKKAFFWEESCKMIFQGKGTHYDPMVVEAFIQAKDEMENVYNRFKETNIDNPDLST